jgi:hypothetical protein
VQTLRGEPEMQLFRDSDEGIELSPCVGAIRRPALSPSPDEGKH